MVAARRTSFFTGSVRRIYSIQHLCQLKINILNVIIKTGVPPPQDWQNNKEHLMAPPLVDECNMTKKVSLETFLKVLQKDYNNNNIIQI